MAWYEEEKPAARASPRLSAHLEGGHCSAAGARRKKGQVQQGKTVSSYLLNVTKFFPVVTMS